MSQPKTLPPGAANPQVPPVVVKKYANRRLYNTESSSYITLDNLAEMVRAGRDFVVYDAKTSDDITRSVLTQIIVEEESKGGAMLPTPFLRQLIGLYGGNLQGLVPRYLEQSMGAFAEQQQRLRSAVSQTMGTFMPPGFEEIGRQNMAMIERAMNLFTPFYRGDAAEGAPGAEAAGGPGAAPAGGQGAGRAGPGGGTQAAERVEIDALRAEVETLRRQLAAAREAKD